jgi:hypothetical protein
MTRNYEYGSAAVDPPDEPDDCDEEPDEKAIARTADEFKEAAEVQGHTKWPIHKCSMCGYQCAFLFNAGEVSYDNGCNCVTFRTPPSRRTWDDVAAHYNRQSDAKVIEKMNRFWGFDG